MKIQKLNTRGNAGLNARGQDMREAKKQGGLNAEIQSRIGHQLRAMYDDIVRQGVPERFVELVRKLDVPPPNHHVENTGDETIKNDGRD